MRHTRYALIMNAEFISRPSAESINRTSLFLPIWAEAMNNIEKQLFPERKDDTVKAITSVYASSTDTVGSWKATF